MMVAYSGGEREVKPGDNFKLTLDGSEWQVVKLRRGESMYSPSGLGGTPVFACQHIFGASTALKYKEADGLVNFCGDSIAASLLSAGPKP